MQLPDCITPRPGEDVIFYNESVKIEGKFVGYNVADALIIQNQFGSQSIIDDFLKVRPKDPLNRAKPSWDLLHRSGGTIKATPDEIAAFDKLLNVRIPPGPCYMEFITELWARGYETFLVGGTVRDVINGQKANDVDLVTSMPFNLLEPLVESMFGDKNFSRARPNGFMSVAPKERFDPSIDVKNFFLSFPGTNMATFGSNFEIDHRLRDFSFNAIYYDPINHFYLDPSGRGIQDAKDKVIHIIKDVKFEHPNYANATVLIRFFKFLNRGYSYTDESLKQIQDTFIREFSSLGHTKRISHFKRQILKKSPKADHRELISQTKQFMIDCGCSVIWESFYEEHVEELQK
ncbi:hypothetical protein [Mucilaginibacter sp. R-33]|uniref:hypothetical protein n=1 Tax=Mucilaginibacter sp. R-33 TaxID=3416711 RepID=UPI003CF8C0F4